MQIEDVEFVSQLDVVVGMCTGAPPSPTASTDQRPGCGTRWCGADRGLRLSPEPCPGIVGVSDQRRGSISRTASIDIRLRRGGSVGSRMGSGDIGDPGRG